MRLRIQVDKSVAIEYETAMAPDDFKEFMYEFLEYQSNLIVERINEVIRRQLYSWAPLSESYIKWKQKMGLSPHIWEASGQTRKAIHYWYSPSFGKGQFFIGVHPTLKHRNYLKGGGLGNKKGTRLIDIIRYVELGTRRMPPRPLFTKVFAEFNNKKRQKQLYDDFIKQRKGL